MTKQQKIFAAKSIVTLPLGIIVCAILGLIIGPIVATKYFVAGWWVRYKLQGVTLVPRGEVEKVMRMARMN